MTPTPPPWAMRSLRARTKSVIPTPPGAQHRAWCTSDTQWPLALHGKGKDAVPTIATPPLLMTPRRALALKCVQVSQFTIPAVTSVSFFPPQRFHTGFSLQNGLGSGCTASRLRNCDGPPVSLTVRALRTVTLFHHFITGSLKNIWQSLG